MPAPAATNAPLYAERLSLPWYWWVIALLILAVGGAEVFAGFDWHVMLVVYGALGLPMLALLLAMGRARIRVDTRGVHAGGRTLAPEQVGDIRVLDRRQTRLLLGPQGDPAAHVYARGWIGASVAVQTVGVPATPYWLLSTRRPEQLAAAIARLGAAAAALG